MSAQGAQPPVKITYATMSGDQLEGLHAARHLYEGAGFRLVEMKRGSRWGAEVMEQRFELHLP